MMVLSLFPGIDLLGRGFEEAGYCVVRGPDTLWGGDIRTFSPPRGRFEGVIGGSPCQDFSKLRRTPPSGYGLEMLGEYVRCVEAAQPNWWLLENVPGVPDVQVEGYTHQRFDLRASDVGLPQSRLRHFQFGSRHNLALVLARPERVAACEPACTASEGQSSTRRSWGDFCALMGLPRNFDLSALPLGERYRAVGNGVPVPMAVFIARNIKESLVPESMARLCSCGCGRPVTGRQVAAGPACRKRLQRQRDSAAAAGGRRVTFVTNRPECDPACSHVAGESRL